MVASPQAPHGGTAARLLGRMPRILTSAGDLDEVLRSSA